MEPLEAVLDKGSTPGNFPKEASDFGRDNREPYGGVVERRGGGEDKMEKKEKTENKPLEEGDESMVSGSETKKVQQAKVMLIRKR